MATKNTTPTVDILPIRTSHLAKRFGIKATALRRVLRSMPDYADGVHTNYRWAENDKRISAIEKQLKELEKQKTEREAAAKAALAARVAAAKKQEAVDTAHNLPAAV